MSDVTPHSSAAEPPTWRRTNPGHGRPPTLTAEPPTWRRTRAREAWACPGTAEPPTWRRTVPKRSEITEVSRACLSPGRFDPFSESGCKLLICERNGLARRKRVCAHLTPCLTTGILACTGFHPSSCPLSPWSTGRHLIVRSGQSIGESVPDNVRVTTLAAVAGRAMRSTSTARNCRALQRSEPFPLPATLVARY